MPRKEAIQLNLDPAQLEVEINYHGPQVRERLIQANTLLRPDQLKVLLPDHGAFKAVDEHLDFWLKESKQLIKHKKTGKVFLLLSGAGAAGKDSMRKAIEAAIPGQVRKLVTATTRKAREGEAHGKDYWFYDDVHNFLADAHDGEFLEFVQEGSRWYGVPKRSLREALQGEEQLIITHAEMSAWPKIEKFVASLPKKDRPLIVKVFLLPQMPANEYFCSHLPKVRPDDYKERQNRSGWEFRTAASAADMILANPLDPQGEKFQDLSRRLITYLNQYLKRSTVLKN